jgi:flagellar L-ring protein precursor FlgH
MERFNLFDDGGNAMRFVLTIVLLIPAVMLAAPAPSMFADKVARQVGDILTVQIVENTTATVTAGTNTKEEYNADLTGSGTGGLSKFIPFGASGGTSSEHKGNGQTNRQGKLTGILTARVVEVFPNGNLRIEGQKCLLINGEKQMTVLTGIVRPEDISPQNVITSDAIADAELSFKGKGVLANAERPGIITRIFDWLF